MKHADRKVEVADAAWRVIVEQGLDRATMRAIARELNCTTGVVTHYFQNKQELILFALHQVTDRLQAIMERQLTAAAGLDRIVAVLSAFLPLDQERKEILRVWVAFLGYAVGRNELMQRHQESAGRLRQLLVTELEALREQGKIAQSCCPETEANVLLALANGLSLDSVLQSERLSADHQLLAIRRQLESLTGP